MILLISAFQIARIIGVSHHHLHFHFFLLKHFLMVLRRFVDMYFKVAIADGHCIEFVLFSGG
jgi:hypothetical protein